MITKKFIITVVLFFNITFITLNTRKKLSLKQFQNKTLPDIYINNLYVGEKNLKEITSLLEKINQQLRQDKVIVVYKKQPIATFSGEQINLHYDKEKLTKKAYLIGRENDLKQRLNSWLRIFLFKKKIIIQEKPKYNRQPLVDFITYLETLEHKPAENALFKFENNRVIAFKKEKNGWQILTKDFFNDIEKAIQSSSKIKKISIKTKVIYPDLTLDKINDFGIKEKIGSGSSNFSGSIPERIHNITLAASKFNGILIPPEKIFSFNENLGKVSSLSGYKKAYVIKEGKTILDDGGGVCQVSTTIFRAALNAGLPILERFAHAYRVSYYENDSQPGFDATVYSPYVDFKLKNDTPAYILIETEIDKDNNLLFFNLYGKKDGRKAIISPVSIWDIIPPLENKYQEDPTLKKGVIKQVEWSAWGAKTKFDYQVWKEGKIIFEKTFFSYYQPWPAVFLVGTGE